MKESNKINANDVMCLVIDLKFMPVQFEGERKGQVKAGEVQVGDQCEGSCESALWRRFVTIFGATSSHITKVLLP